MAKKHLNPIWAAILVVCTTVLLFVFSGQSGTVSNGLSNGLTEMLLSIVGLELSTAEIKVLHYFVRKSAHFGLFFLLGVGLMALFYKYNPRRGFVLASLLSVAVAGANEYHQLLVGTRTASIKDVWLDSSGAVVGCLVYCLLHWLIQYIRKHRQERCV